MEKYGFALVEGFEQSLEVLLDIEEGARVAALILSRHPDYAMQRAFIKLIPLSPIIDTKQRLQLLRDLEHLYLYSKREVGQ
jgi:hypothetical protein